MEIIYLEYRLRDTNKTFKKVFATRKQRTSFFNAYRLKEKTSYYHEGNYKVNSQVALADAINFIIGIN